VKYGWGLFFGDEDGGEMIDAAAPTLTKDQAEEDARSSMIRAIESGFPAPTMLQAVVYDEDGEPQMSMTPRRIATFN